MFGNSIGDLGGFHFRRDEFFAHISWPTGYHVMSIDTFLRALQRDVAWDFFYGTVNFDHVFGTVNHYGTVDLFAGAYDQGYKDQGLDYLETDKAVDAKKVGIEGVSRYGKAALVTMAYDTRFAVVLIGSSGAGGAKLHRRNFGEAVENLTGSAQADTLTGNGAANNLNGGSGGDTIRGGAGNDTARGAGVTRVGIITESTRRGRSRSPAPRSRRWPARRPPRQPSGADMGWGITGTMLSGIIVWGGVGWLLDRWWETRFLTLVGTLLGLTVAIYLVVARFAPMPPVSGDRRTGSTPGGRRSQPRTQKGQR